MSQCGQISVFSPVSHVVPMLDSGVIGAVGGEETRGAYAELQGFPGVPFSRDEASVGVP